MKTVYEKPVVEEVSFASEEAFASMPGGDIGVGDFSGEIDLG